MCTKPIYDENTSIAERANGAHGICGHSRSSLACHWVIILFYIPGLAIYGLPGLNSVTRVQKVLMGWDRPFDFSVMR
jgi:hypothetical protein